MKSKAITHTHTHTHSVCVWLVAFFLNVVEVCTEMSEMPPISGYHLSDEETRLMLREIYGKYRYTADPHGAIGYGAIRDYIDDRDDVTGIFLETAHPAKFLDVMKEALPDVAVDVPPSLAKLAKREKVAELLSTEFADFKAYLMGRDH